MASLALLVPGNFEISRLATEKRRFTSVHVLFFFFLKKKSYSNTTIIQYILYATTRTVRLQLLFCQIWR